MTSNLAYTYDLNLHAWLGDETVIVPDQIGDTNTFYAAMEVQGADIMPLPTAQKYHDRNGTVFQARRRDGSKIKVRLDGDAYGLWTPGTGDMKVRRAKKPVIGKEAIFDDGDGLAVPVSIDWFQGPRKRDPMTLKITIDTERRCWRGAVGRQRVDGLQPPGRGYIQLSPWAQMGALGEQSGPIVYATVSDADGPVERLVVVGSRFDAAVRDKIRAFVAEFPGAEMHDSTTITA